MAVNDQINLDNHRRGLGILTPAEKLRRERPDEFDTVEQAVEFLAQRKAKESEIEAESDTGAENDDKTSNNDETTSKDDENTSHLNEDTE